METRWALPVGGLWSVTVYFPHQSTNNVTMNVTQASNAGPCCLPFPCWLRLPTAPRGFRLRAHNHMHVTGLCIQAVHARCASALPGLLRAWPMAARKVGISQPEEAIDQTRPIQRHSP